MGVMKVAKAKVQKAKAKIQKAKATSKIIGKPKAARKDNGRKEASKAAVMTKAEWLEFQTDEFKKQWPKPEYMLTGEKNQYVRDGGEGAYKDRTREIVTRWTEKTEIEYRPHAKAPGTKSHIRYEEYSSATTVGEALKLGSFPLDWCYDYEHGFIRETGGEKREEPLDISKVDDETKLTDVDRVLVKWFRTELAKRYNLKLADLLVEKGGGESVLMRAHRLVANRKAEEFTAKAARQKRAISEEEVETVLSTWAFAKNAARQNVIPDGKEYVWSDTVGLLRDRQGDIHLTKNTARYPAFVRIINRWLTDRLPKEVASFKFTSLNLNCNYAAKRHRDGNNFGPSMIKAFGKFEGGELCYFPSDDKSSDLPDLKQKDKKVFDIKTDIAMFNGNSAHEVNDFTGQRFSVVYFTLGCHAKAPKEAMADLKKLGFPVPSAKEDPYALLGKPGSTTKPTLRAWKVSALGKTLRR